MKELFAALPRVPLADAKGYALLDTCFVIDAAERGKLDELLDQRVALTSFNAEELEHVAHRLHDKTKESLRRFFKRHPTLAMIDVPVHPGDRAGERAFVASIDSRLLEKVPDASDAVLMVAAMEAGCDVLTKDKHHLFTVVLENFLQERGIHVWKEWKDVQG